MKAPTNLREAGIIVSGIDPTIPRRIERHAIAQLEETGLLLYPIVPLRVVAKETRENKEWYGNYSKGDPLVEVYMELAKKVFV
jgi:chromosome partitioning protein